MKKTILTVVTGSLLATTFLPVAASASSFDGSSNAVITQEITEQDQKKYDSFLAEIEPYMFKTTQGTIEIGKHPEDINATYANEIELLKTHLTPLNQQVLEGTLTVTEDLAFVPTIQTFAGEGVTVYWWGYQYVLNKAGALNFANGMDDLAYGYTTAGALASRFGIPQIGAALALLGGPYYKQLASKIRQKVTSKGVILNITHVAVFTVNPR